MSDETTSKTPSTPAAAPPAPPAKPKSHHCGRPVRLGKKPARHDHRTLRLSRYLPTSLPPPPAACDWSTSAAPDWGLMLNDRLGDCTCAAIGHAIQDWTAANGKEITLTDDDILKAYEVFCGYVPGREDTDQGGIEIDVLNGWRQVGVAGHKIKAYAALNTRDRDEVKQAIFLFGGIYIGLALPLSAQNQVDWTIAESGEYGDPTPGSWGGHAVFVVGYDEDWVYFISWGRKMRMSWLFFIECCEEAYAVLSIDWADSDGAPSKLDLDALEKDLAVVTNPMTSSRPEVALPARAAAAARAKRLAEGVITFEDIDLDIRTTLFENGGGSVEGKNAAGIELGVVIVPGSRDLPPLVTLRLLARGEGQTVSFRAHHLGPFVQALDKIAHNSPRPRPADAELRDEGDDAAQPAQMPVAPVEPAPVPSDPVPPPAAEVEPQQLPPDPDEPGVQGEGDDAKPQDGA